MAEILNIFNFLKEFNELSNPVVTEIKNQKWSLNISDIPMIEEIRSAFLGHDMKDLSYLEVCRPTLLSCPKPQEILLEWIENDWMKLSVNEVKFFEKIQKEPITEKDELFYDEYFDDDPERKEASDLWTSERNRWRTTELPKEKGVELYNKLFQLYSDMKRESESVELILGDGNIRWNTSERIIDHPILLQKVEISFDAHAPSFRVYCGEIKTELYTSMLRVIPTINQRMLSDIVTDIDEGEYDISQIENTKPLFERIINVIDTEGIYVEQVKPINLVPTIHSAPILFLRKRTLGYSSFIQSVIEDLQRNHNMELPGFFRTMTGVYKKPQKEIVEKSWNYSGIDKDVLLTLPANTEQLRIIKYLEKYGAVLVQGPPGTGKTHTIANIIGHLLSQGNNVLVTSNTDKALKVLKDKVYKDPQDSEINLQSLCINLSNSASQKKEMDEAISEIALKSSTLDLHSSQEKIRYLEEERMQLVEKSKQLTKDLVRVRSKEYKDLIYDNHSISPIEAAKFLHSGIGMYNYIDGKSNKDEVGLPLTHEEQVFLYASNGQLNKEEEGLLKKDYPNDNQVIDDLEFKENIDRINELKDEIAKNEFIEDVKFLVDLDFINRLLDESKRLASKIVSFEPLERSIVNTSMIDPTYPNLWSDVIKRTEDIPSKYESYNRLKLNDDFSITNDSICEQSLLTLSEIIDSGREKPIGLFSKGSWKKLKKKIKVNRKEIETRDEFIKVHKIVSYEIERKEIIRRIKKLLMDVVAPEKLEFDDFENKVRIYREKIIEALTWFQSNCQGYFNKIEDSICWTTENKLMRTSLMSNIDVALSELQTVTGLLQTQIYKNELSELDKKIDDYKRLLDNYADQNPLIDNLAKSVQSHDLDSYNNNIKALKGLIRKREMADRRETLRSRIREIAPVLASEIEKREGIHSQTKIPDNFDEAWKYFQIKNQIERLDNSDPAKIQLDMEQLNKALLKNARALAYEKAWYEKIRNQTDKQNQALHGWRNTIKQIGKGTGKKAPMLKAEARKLMPLCQTAIPIWIMPLNKVVESFNPGKNKFDVIIIDEASQANILALPVLYLAKKVIIVGDDKQVSPGTVGIKTEEVTALITQHLERIPNNHLFNELTSLYDMAKSSGFRPLMLTEHFRCLPEIIEFSNILSYNGKIKPLRDSSNVSVYPPVVEYRVSGASRNDKKINKVEAEHIVSLVRAFMDTDEYVNQTIGIISMLGNEQSAIIDRMLQSVIDPVAYEERRIQCGTPPQFQGDERDIIILSLVDSPNENGGPLRLLSEDGYNDKYRKRYNVAVSRARNQLWVVHSLNPEIDLKPDDLRLKLIKHAMNPNLERDSLLERSESPFEMEVMKYLLDRNYKVIPQFKVGAYRIDMVIQYKDKKVALECDGERFHNKDNLGNDLARQAILERLGWCFIRIRGSVYYRDPEQTMKDVVKSLSEYGISPSYDEVDSELQSDNSLIDAVKIRARAYRGEGVDEGAQPKPEPDNIKNPVTKPPNTIISTDTKNTLPPPQFDYRKDKKTKPSQNKGSDQIIKINKADKNTKSTVTDSENTKPKFDFRNKKG
ncbi:AAA domain-containing protein (plasmid) [Fusobacteria bacterium ZRK30]|nr:AAA domain-containing protein [Fusobacteria bacterium ZRK30]